MSPDRARQPVVAGQFYSGTRGSLEDAVADCVADYAPPDDLGQLLGGVVPHAGWMFSGPTAAKVFAALAAAAKPDVFILFGAAHRYHAEVASVYPSGGWATPLGEARIDEAVASSLVKAAGGAIEPSRHAHDGEHSIEVQIPFIQSLCPDARFVPVAVPAGSDAVAAGEAAAECVRSSDERIVFVASTDLTHYGMGYGAPAHGPLPGAMPWMRENDQRFIRLVEELRAEDIVPEAMGHDNACGPGAVAAAVSAARSLGAARGRVLEYTTSADVVPEPFADRAVGYVGIVFERTG